MNNELTFLRQRVLELENIALEQARLEQLIDDAAHSIDLKHHMTLGVLYVDVLTHRIVDANEAAVKLLGYAQADLLSMTIDALELEIASSESESAEIASSREPRDDRIYTALYLHQSGQRLNVSVYRRQLTRDNHKLYYYRLSEMSLYRRVWYELQRREDDSFTFHQKLTALNEITVQLSKLESFDALCRQIVQFGIERLDFDRLGLWLVDADNQLMRGTYGVDEQGNIRAEYAEAWSYVGTHVSSFINGITVEPLVFDNSPIYNEKSEIIRFGWQMTVPVLYGSRCLGTLAADNYLRNQPIRDYEPELMRLYGITVAHLLQLHHSREQAVALRLAQERAHTLREFITNIGHDFRTPLSVINTRLYLLRRTVEADKRDLLINDIQQQMKHISEIVDNTLELIALQSSPTLMMTRTSVKALIEEVIEAHQSALDAKNIHVSWVVEGKPLISVDRDYLLRALDEIMKNAVQYSAPGAEIAMRCEAADQELAIHIQDNGIGMDQETSIRAFDPLYRNDAARTERRSGFGLAIAKAIIEAHGGRIEVKSAPNEGSTFTIILPM